MRKILEALARACVVIGVVGLGISALATEGGAALLLAFPLQEQDPVPEPPDGNPTEPAPPPAPALEELERRIVDADAAVRDIAAGDLVRRPEAEAFIRKMLAPPVDAAREPAVISLLQAIRVLGATHYLPSVLDLTVRTTGNGVRDAARATIREMRARPEAAASLLRIFRENAGDPERRRKAVEFLKEYRCLRCLPALIEVGSGSPSPSPMVREAIVDALGTITGEEFGSDWKKWIEWRNRVLVVGEGGDVDWARVQSEINETLRGKMLGLRERVVELTTRNLDQMKAHNGGAYKEELLRLVGASPYAEIRAEAATRLGNFGDPGEPATAPLASADVDVLLGALADPESRVVAAAVWSLGKAGAVPHEGDEAWAAVQERIREAILPRVRSEFAEVRRNAVEAAGRVGGPRATSALLQLLEELVASSWRDARLRETILRALGEPGCASASSMTALARVLAEDPVPLNRERAADTMGRIRDGSAIAPLSQTLKGDPELTVRWAAVRSLVRIGGDEALAVLTEGLADRGIRQRCASALGDLGRAEAADALISALRAEDEEKIRITVIESLGKIRSPKAIDPLLEWLENGTAAESTAAESALNAIWDEDADLLVRGGRKLVAIATRKADLAGFAVKTLEHADDLMRQAEPADPARVRARLSLATAYYLDGKLPQAEAIHQSLYPMRAQLGRESACELEIGVQLGRAAKGKPFEAYESLKQAANADFDAALPHYWRIVATAAEIMIETAKKAGDSAIDRKDAFTRAQAILTMKERPATLPTDLIERLDRIGGVVRDGLREVSEAPVRAEEERIKDAILRLGSEVTREDPEALIQALKEIESIPLEKSVPCVIGFLEAPLPATRKHAFDLLRGIFPEAEFAFDPAEADATLRQTAVAAIRDWWAKHPKNPSAAKEGN